MQESTDPRLKFLIDNILQVFVSDELSIELLTHLGCVGSTITCPACGLGSLMIGKDRNTMCGVIFRCNNSVCLKKKNFFYCFKNKLPKINIKIIIYCAYLYSLKINNYQVCIMTGISEKTYINLKKIFMRSISLSNLNNEKIGGNGMCVQIDETACNRRRLITSPTSEEVYVRGTKWVIGVFCENTGNIRLAVLDDRSVECIERFIKSNVKVGSIVKSDGFASYPRAVANAGCTHLIVNHSHGFVSSDGTHTNSIENIWSHLKVDIRSRRGVMFENLSDFIFEWTCYHNMVKQKKKENIIKFFKTILKNL